MALNKAQRLRIVLDLIKDGDVSSEQAYAACDKVPQDVLDRYVSAHWDRYYGGEETDAKKMTALLRGLRTYLAAPRRTALVETAEATAMENAHAAADAERDADLGND